VHSPIGGQGINYGLLDLEIGMCQAKRVIEASTNLGHGSSDHEIKNIFENYGAERRGAAIQVTKSNAMATKALTSNNPVVRLIRDTTMKRFLGGNRFRCITSNP